MRASPEVRLMLAPAREYARLASIGRETTVLRAMSRPALSLLIFGAASAIATTGRADLQVVLSGAICWGFVVAIQIIAALLLVRSNPNARLHAYRSLELWFLAHGPWSLWTLAAAAVAFSIPAIVSLEVMLLSAVAPTLWTMALVFAYCRQVLDVSVARALRLTVVHQGVTWALIIGYLAVTTQIWPRILGSLAA
jgi:hypothetical protein